MLVGVCGCNRLGIDQFQRLTAPAVRLAEAIILERETAVVVERGAPQHRAVIHHAMNYVPNGFLMAKTAGFIGCAQISRVDKLNELQRLVIQQHIGVARVGRTLPKNWMARLHVRLALREAGHRIAAVTIRATEHHVRAGVHAQGVDALVTFQAAAALAHRLFRVELSRALGAVGRPAVQVVEFSRTGGANLFCAQFGTGQWGDLDSGGGSGGPLAMGQGRCQRRNPLLERLVREAARPPCQALD